MRAFSWHPWIPGTLKLDLILSLFKCAVLCIEDFNLLCQQAQWLGMTRRLKKRFWLESHRSTLVVEGRTCLASMQEPHQHWIGSKVWGSIRLWGRLIMSVHPAWAHSASFQDSSWLDGIIIYFVNIFLEIIYLLEYNSFTLSEPLKGDWRSCRRFKVVRPVTWRVTKHNKIRSYTKYRGRYNCYHFNLRLPDHERTWLEFATQWFATGISTDGNSRIFPGILTGRKI